MEQLRRLRGSELFKIAEFIDRSRFVNKTIEKKWSGEKLKEIQKRLERNNLPLDQLKMSLEGGLLAYLLHCEARVASFLGRGYYTIGPCGEELLGLISLNLKQYDLTALHYRHLATSVVRQLKEGKTIGAIALDRARGFTCSLLDPVTTGRHCSIGGNHQTEFLVTSTLASQCPPALGRALGISLSKFLLGNKSNFSSDAVSYVSLGDGSINNAHFLSALNLAKYSEHHKFKCPLVFVISDNKICISLKGNGYIDKFVSELKGIYVKVADGSDFLDIYEKSNSVIEYSRTLKRPSVLLLSNLPRRFGHAATDRQFAYFNQQEIQAQIDNDPLSDTFSLLLSLGVYREQDFKYTFESISKLVQNSFDLADTEPKNSSRAALINSNSFQSEKSGSINIPFGATRFRTYQSELEKVSNRADMKNSAACRPEVMRKHMTRVFDELLESRKELVYIGEDVQHGGYYLVTDGLFKKHPYRVRDFPPDEGTLIGAGIGFSQSGLIPIVEIPYAKYLDCGADMFQEAIISNWLSNGKQPNGMVFRLQGFDKGIFGGNFHTHNMISIPPGLDVLCFSNGNDYVRGMRFAVEQAIQGRVIMSVDSTDLLNRRHLSEEKKDEFMLSVYPDANCSPSYQLDEITIYHYQHGSIIKHTNLPKVVIVSYGNGVPTCALAQMTLTEKNGDRYEFIVIDTPCLSQTPKQLEQFFRDNKGKIEHVVFADICKYGSGMPLSARLIDLQNNNLLSTVKNWKVIGAAPTYNPLGTYLTFLSKEDVVSTVDSMIGKSS